MTVLTVNVRRRYSALVTIPLDGFLNFNPSATFTPGDLKLVRPAQQKVCSLRSTRTNRAANSRSPLTMIISRARTPTLMRRRRLTPPLRQHRPAFTGLRMVSHGWPFADTFSTDIHRWRGEPAKLPADIGEYLCGAKFLRWTKLVWPHRPRRSRAPFARLRKTSCSSPVRRVAPVQKSERTIACEASCISWTGDRNAMRHTKGLNHEKQLVSNDSLRRP